MRSAFAAVLFAYVLLAGPTGLGGNRSRRLVDTLTVTGIDSTEAPGCEGPDAVVWRIAISGAGRHDTIRQVTRPWPVRVDSTTVIGLVTFRRACEQRSFFRYDGITGRVAYPPLPSDLSYNFQDVSVSPDGRFTLYLASLKGGFERVVVRRWPSGQRVATGPRATGCDCDTDRHHAHWVTADSFELGTDIGTSGAGVYERVSGSVRRGLTRVDTLKVPETYWHPDDRAK